MNRVKWPALILWTMLLSSGGIASESTQQAFLRFDAFRDLFPQNTLVRVNVTPGLTSRWSEYAVGLQETAGDYRIIYLQGARGEPQDGRTSEPASRCEATIEAERAKRILDLWWNVLDRERTRRDNEVKDARAQGFEFVSNYYGFDGDGFDFIAHRGDDMLTIGVGGPPKNSTLEVLANLSTNMARYCRATRWYIASPLGWWFTHKIDKNLDDVSLRLRSQSQN